MSLNKSATHRRLSLLAGASIISVGLSLGVSLTPTAAIAANECGNPSANGSAPDTLVCPPGNYTSGIDYSTTTDGDLTVVLRDRVNTGTSNTAGTGGIRLFGDAGEDMSLVREDTPGVVGDPRIVNTAGRAVDVRTEGSGNALVDLTDNDPAAGEPSTPAASAPTPLRVTGGTDAIAAEAVGTGNVSVVIAETGEQTSTDHRRAVITAGATAGSNGSGIVARSTSGSITVDAGGAQFSINGTNGGGAIDALSTSGNIDITTGAGGSSGRLFGIRAQTGAGAITVDVGGSVSANNTIGEAAIDTVVGTGSTLITINNGTVGSTFGTVIGPVIRAVSASTSATAVNVQNTGGRVAGRVDFSGVTAGGVTFNNTGATATAGIWTPSGVSTFGGGNDTVTLGGVGIYNSTDGTVMNFGAGNDIFNIGGNYSVTTRTVGGVTEELTGGTTLNFGSGADAINVSGVLTVDYMTITGLETLNNSGLILLGAGREGFQSLANFQTTDGETDDVLSLPGVAYSASGNARLGVDVAVLGAQADCASPTGAGDCLDLRGGSTSGTTLLTVTLAGDDAALGGYGGVTVVDVQGGESAADHFVLDPNSQGYLEDPVLGGAIDRAGLFRYTLRYDAENQRHVIFGLPRSEVMEYAMLSSAAQSIWHLTAETVTDRQTDLHRRSEGGEVWVRMAGEYTKRDAVSAFDLFGDTFAVDAGHKLYAGTIIGGMDLVSGHSGGLDYLAGVQVGYVAASFDLNASETSGRFSGATGGLYGSIWNERYFLDGTFNMNGLTLDYDSPALGSKTNTYTTAFGARLDGGMRLALAEGLALEPLASLAFVRTGFEEISLSGGEIRPDEAMSRRGALGLRLAGTLGGEALNATYFVTGRAWNEFDGDSNGVVSNPGADLPFADEFSGGFGEAEAGINLYNADGTLSGFASAGTKFKDGYSATNLSLGIRMRW